MRHCLEKPREHTHKSSASGIQECLLENLSFFCVDAKVRGTKLVRVLRGHARLSHDEMNFFSGDTLIDLFSPVFCSSCLNVARQQGQHLTSDNAMLSDKNHCRTTVRYRFMQCSPEYA
jgi:hypothetical protein